jgi:hypothetical protein
MTPMDRTPINILQLNKKLRILLGITVLTNFFGSLWHDPKNIIYL